MPIEIFNAVSGDKKEFESLESIHAFLAETDNPQFWRGYEHLEHVGASPISQEQPIEVPEPAVEQPSAEVFPLITETEQVAVEAKALAIKPKTSKGAK